MRETGDRAFGVPGKTLMRVPFYLLHRSLRASEPRESKKKKKKKKLGTVDK